MSSGRAPHGGDESPDRYDELAAEQGWHGHELLFGLMCELVQPGDCLLDVGIGTGMSSALFHRAGVRVSGFDRSSEMLAACAAKGFAVQLLQHDLQTVPYPYPTASFDHVISLGVLNFYPDLEPVVREAARLLKPHGVFGFSVEEQKPGQAAEYWFGASGDSVDASAGSRTRMCRHVDRDVRELLRSNGIEVLKDMEFSAGRPPSVGMDLHFRAYVGRKRE